MAGFAKRILVAPFLFSGIAFPLKVKVSKELSPTISEAILSDFESGGVLHVEMQQEGDYNISILDGENEIYSGMFSGATFQLSFTGEQISLDPSTEYTVVVSNQSGEDTATFTTPE